MGNDASSLIDFAREAADVKMRMVDSFDSGFGAFHWNMMLRASRASTQSLPDSECRDMADELAKVSGTVWRAAESFVVAPAMTAIIAAAAQALPTSRLVITKTTPPAPIGVVHFPEPIYMRATSGDLCPTSAITWNHVTAPGSPNGELMLCSYTHTDHTTLTDRLSGYLAAQPDFRVGPRLLCFFETAQYQQALSVDTQRSPSSRDGEREWQAAADGRIIIDTAVHHRPLLRALYSFWTISQQKLAATTPAPPPRAARRRAERASIKHTTRVISLRRTTTPTDPDQPPQWHYQVRFVVRGHWRRLASGDFTWVNTHLKGPADAPLLGGEKINLLHR